MACSCVGCVNSPIALPPTDCRSSSFALLGSLQWPADSLFAGTRVGGLSAIDYDGASGLYYLLSDDRGQHDPVRLYTARISYDAHGLHQWVLQDRIWLRNAQQQIVTRATPSKSGRPDPEALRLLPGVAGPGRMLWSSEGDFARHQGPELVEAGRDGSWLLRWPLPPTWHLPAAAAVPSELRKGPRNGLTLEGMALDADGRQLWLAMEGPLWQDGPLPTNGHAGGPVRIAAYDIASRKPLRELAYQPDGLPAGLWLLPGRALNGISEILADGPHHLLVLERSYAPQHGFGARLYRIATNDGQSSNTLNQEQLQAGSYQAVSKQLVLDFSSLALRQIDNLEGMTWGPALPDGRRVLLLVSDDNFNPAQVTQLLALVENAASCAP